MSLEVFDMVILSTCRLAGAGTLALVLTIGAGEASADPDLSPVINTTCTYAQVESALRAENPAAAAGLSASPTAQGALRGFLASTPDQRQQIYQELRSRPRSQQYVDEYAGAVLQVANTCNNY